MERRGEERFSDIPDNHPNFDFDSNNRGAGFSGENHHHHHHHQHQHHRNHHNHRHYHNNLHSFPNNQHNSEPYESFGNGEFNSGRKRGFPQPPQGFLDGGSLVKLYVSSIPRTAREADIRPLFEPHGNVIEVIFIKDKRTGQQQGSCFVKYATLEEADRAIRALHNQLSLPGGGAPLVVRYADGKHERLGNCHERLGGPECKVYVNFLNKHASKKEIEEVFSPYGIVEDIYILQDEWKQSRGSGFIKFASREMALSAIKALNGTYTMRGCDHPLIVRFADPKKPRIGELRGNSEFHGPGSRPLPQELVARSNSNFSGPWGGSMVPNALPPVSPSIASSCQSNSTAPVQPVSGSGSSPSEAVIASVSKLHEPASNSMQQAPLPQQSPSQLSWMEQQTHTSQENFHSSQESLGNQLHQIQPSQENHREQPTSILPIYQSGATGNKIQTVALPHSASLPGASSTMSSASGVTTNPLAENSKNCDWSEHICPDGYVYYYNCITCESRWEKPEEFALYEQQLEEEEQQLQQQQPRSPKVENLCHVPESEAHSTKQDSHIEEMQKPQPEPLMAHSPQQKFHKEEKLQTGLEPHSPQQESHREEEQKLQTEPSVEHSSQQESHEKEGQKVLTEPLAEEQKIQAEPMEEHSPQEFHEEEQKIQTQPTVEHSTQQECHEEMEQKIQTEALVAHSPQQESHTEEVKFRMELPQQQDLLQNHSLPELEPNLVLANSRSCP